MLPMSARMSWPTSRLSALPRGSLVMGASIGGPGANARGATVPGNNDAQSKTVLPRGRMRLFRAPYGDDSAVNERATHMLEQSRLSHSTDSPNALHSKRVVDPSMQGLGDLPDLLLVERTRGRDSRAFETLMRRYNRRLYRIARSILSDDGSAEEAVRAAHIRAFVNLDRYEPAGKFGAWLARLAFNEALTLRRHSPLATGAAERADATATSLGRPIGNGVLATTVRPTGGLVSAIGTAPPIGSTPAAALEVAEPAAAELSVSKQQLEDAIDALPEVFRTVLVLRVVEELSGVEVAVCLGLNETTVRTRLYRAQQRLKVDVARRLRAEPFDIFALTPERCDRIVTQVFARLHSVPPASEPR
jgi:RNA polymerase sigma-70 factor (ECF subfamily)